MYNISPVCKQNDTVLINRHIADVRSLPAKKRLESVQ